MKKVLLALVTFVLVGCQISMNGEVNFEQDFTYKKRSKTKKIDAGTYDASLKVSNKDVTFKIDDGWFDSKIEMRIDRDDFPKDGGPFSFSQFDLRQPFSIEGDFNKTSRVGDVIRDEERCQYWDREYICREGRDGRRVCRYVDVRRWGWQRVEYQDEFTTYDVAFDMIHESGAKGDFDGTKTYVYRNYHYRGICSRF